MAWCPGGGLDEDGDLAAVQLARKTGKIDFQHDESKKHFQALRLRADKGEYAVYAVHEVEHSRSLAPSRGPGPNTGATRTRLSTERIAELCSAFDETFELATLCGDSASSGIASFMDEFWDMAGCPELGTLVGYRATVDTTAMKLPAFPEPGVRLLETLGENISPIELGDIAASTPLLKEKLLSYANSPPLASRVRIVGLNDAVDRLGISEARKVLIAVLAGNLFCSESLASLWNHSLRVARTASDVLATLVGVNPEIAFVAGLFHDVGRIGFMKLPAGLRIRERGWLEAGFPVCYAESLAYGIDHAVFGAHLLKSWELPNGIIEAVSLHNRPESSDANLNAILSLADSPLPLPPYSACEDLWPAMRRSAAIQKTGLAPDQLEDFYLKQ